MALTLTAKALANAVAGTDYIVAIVDGPVTSKVFTTVGYTGTSGVPALGSTNYTVEAPYTANSAGPKLPQLTTLTAVSASDNGTDGYVGQLVATLTPDSGDVVNASSPMTYRFSANALAITAASST